MRNTTYVFGHRRPDTDSVAASIALSYLKNTRGHNTTPVILDHLNKETEFVLNYFNIKEPEFLNDVKLRIEDIDYYKDCFIEDTDSIKKAYENILKQSITGIPIVNKRQQLLGLITMKMIAHELISGDFTHLTTSYDNLLETLEGKEVLRFDEEIHGEIYAAAFRSTTILNSVELNNNHIVIVGDRHSVIEYAIENNVKLLIIVGGREIKSKHLEMAKKNKVNIISTNLDTFHTTKMIGLSSYVKNLLTKARIERIKDTDYLDAFMELSGKQGYNNYPVVNSKNKCLGLIRVTDIKGINRKQVILVDHNELDQSAIGLKEAEIVEIVDHHKIGDLSTNVPINFRNMNVGSTSTIIYNMYLETNTEIPMDMAGLMLSGIISDTLKFTSPTTTERDRVAAIDLARIAELDIDTYATRMFKEGTKLDGKTVEEVITADMKIFPIEKEKVAVSQVLTLNSEEILDKKDEYIAAFEEILKDRRYSMGIMCLTDIIANGSYILYDPYNEERIKEALGLKEIYQGIYLEGILSRKKQIIPKIMAYIKGR